MSTKILYTAEEVNKLIENDSAVLIDIRDVDDFNEGHIPGAINIPDIFYFLSKSTEEGLEELKEKYTELFSQAGLSPDKTAIVYEHSLDTRYGGSCRGYWLLSYLGHLNSGILDGGMMSWYKKEYKIEKDKVDIERYEFETNIQSDLIVTKEEVFDSLDSPEVILLDNRDKVEWIGESSSPYGVDFAPRKGRIPGAIWIEWYNFMDQDKKIPSFKSKSDIKVLCADKGILPEDNIIIYCFKGARASNTYVALKEAGFKNLRIYFGSWNEWSRDLDMPIEEGKPQEIPGIIEEEMVS